MGELGQEVDTPEIQDRGGVMEMNNRATVSGDARTITVHIPFAIRKRGGRKLVVTQDGGEWAPRPRVYNAMVKALARAFREAAIAACGGGAAGVALALFAADIRQALTETFAGRLRDDARDRCPEAFGCHGWTERPRLDASLALAAAALAAAAAAPLVVLQTVMAWALVANALTMRLRLRRALHPRLRREVEPAPGRGWRTTRSCPRSRSWCRCCARKAVARRLLDALAAMDYPAALLDIKLVLEADDAITRAALARAELPRTIEVVSVPPDTLKTKPKAMNRAPLLPRRDRRGVRRRGPARSRADPRGGATPARSAPPEVACVQGYLDFYNSSDNWLSRCFTLEYAIWFRVVLLGVQRLGLPIPLGGTSVFFRRGMRSRAARRLGCAQRHRGRRPRHAAGALRLPLRDDPLDHLGRGERRVGLDPPAVALAEGGLCRHLGDAHAPAAGALARLGAAGFLGFQVLFLGAITSYLALPLFWAAWLAGAGFEARDLAVRSGLAGARLRRIDNRRWW